jgi:peptidoglycan/LPS O-acetylase OafA/YrhL
VMARHILGRGALAFVGRVSYSAYLYHLPLLLVMQKYLAPAGASFALAYLALVLFVAWISWRFVERPFLARR